ncbi:DUF6616 family protein [Streptomyces scopuliridis]|uniref:DUF6616 family protein n=1 Tax=Streptomyces scopuliridis TaxID=452529 RepID=UPI00368D006C
MHAFLELWHAKPEWLNLPRHERESFLADVAGSMAQLDALGAESIGWGTAAPIDDKDAGYPFFAVWRVPSAAVATRFSQELEAAGWYTYFDQVNVVGELRSPGDILKIISELKP